VVLACVCAPQILAHVPPMQRERVAQVLMAPGYLRKLLDLFRVSSTAGTQHVAAQHGVYHIAAPVAWQLAIAVQLDVTWRSQAAQWCGMWHGVMQPCWWQEQCAEVVANLLVLSGCCCCCCCADARVLIMCAVCLPGCLLFPAAM
jgi:hypothetical protein